MNRKGSVLAAVGLASNAAASWGILLAIIAIAALSDGVIESSLYALAHASGRDVISWAQGGQSFSGVVISLLRVVTKAAFPQTDGGITASTYLYFGVASACCLACLVMLFTVPTLRNLKFQASNTPILADFRRVLKVVVAVKLPLVLQIINYLVTLSVRDVRYLNNTFR